MEVEIWSRLPQALQEKVLAHLPIQHLLRLRPSCKRFNHLPSNFSFAHLHRHSSPPQSCILASGTTASSMLELYLVDDSCCWRRLPLETMPHEPYLLLAASDGLLLFSVQSPADVFLLWNPCTGAFSRLPKVPRLSSPVLTGLCRDRATGEYKVVCAGSSDSEGSPLNAVAMLYDSRIGSWRESTKLPFKNYSSSAEPVCVKGRIVFRAFVGQRRVVLVFDADKEKWISIFPSMDKNEENQLGIACLGSDIRMVVRADLDIGIHKVEKGRRSLIGVLPFELWETEWSDAMYFWNQARDEGEEFEFGDVEVTTHVVRSGTLVCVTVRNVEHLIVFDISKAARLKLSTCPFEHVYNIFNFDLLL